MRDASLKRIGSSEGGDLDVESTSLADDANNRIIEEIIAVQREFYFENKNRESDRRRKLRDIIDRATPLKGQ